MINENPRSLYGLELLVKVCTVASFCTRDPVTAQLAIIVTFCGLVFMVNKTR